MTERWRPVLGHEGLYEVSDHGRVRSLDRVLVKSDGSRQPIKGRVLSGKPGFGGYPEVGLRRDGRGRTARIHRLVLEAFVRPPNPREQACHWDDDPANNHLSNLRWGTRSDNERDKIRNGRHNNSTKTHCPQGHPYDEENTRMYQGRRYCRACHRNRRLAASPKGSQTEAPPLTQKEK